MCKASKGGLKDTPLDTMVFKVLQQVKERMNMDASLVEEICLGNVCLWMPHGTEDMARLAKCALIF